MLDRELINPALEVGHSEVLREVFTSAADAHDMDMDMDMDMEAGDKD